MQRRYLATEYLYFFAMAHFAAELLDAVTEKHRPAIVYLWQDAEKPIVDGGWFPGEGAIFAQVATTWLEARNIDVVVVERDPALAAVLEPPSPIGRLRSTLRNLPPSIFLRMRSIYRFRRSLFQWFQRLLLRARVALIRCRRRLTQRPLILFWGSHVDAVYHAELAEQWCRELGWAALRVEHFHPGSLATRRLTRNATMPLGESAELMFATFGDRRSAGSKVQTCARWAMPRGAFEIVGLEDGRRLRYQWDAMIRYAALLDGQSFASILRRIDPDCVVTHLYAPVAMAARSAGLPSVVVAHGGIFFPEFVSLHGDVNVVAGEAQKRFCEDRGYQGGPVVGLGWPHLNRPRSRVAIPIDQREIASVLFLATDPDAFFWETNDLHLYAEALQQLRDMATGERFRLIVKLHPRYGKAAFYERVFRPDGVRVRVELTPELDDILRRADIAVVSGLTTGILDVLSAGIPTVGFFYPLAQEIRSTVYHRMLSEALPEATNLEQLESIIARLASSPTERIALAQRQEKMLPRFLAASGSVAARRVAGVCEELIRSSERSR